MIAVIQTILTILIVFTSILTVYYSFRYRRQTDVKIRGLNSSKMNISMGAMLTLIAVSQLFFFTDSNTRRIFGTICLLLGLFNLFSGIRNLGIFGRMKQQ